jgi:hypothetical protein
MTDAWDKCRLPDDLPFESWVAYVFDHPVLDPQWWWQAPESGHLQEWNTAADLPRTLQYLTRLFNDPAEIAVRFSRPQIDQGLNFLVSNTCSNHMFTLTNTKLPWSDRRACFDAMIPLYSKLFAPVYGHDLANGVYELRDPDQINFACYMWWDIIPLYGGMKHPDRDRIN